MNLAQAKEGLGAVTAQDTMELVELYVKLSKEYLEEHNQDVGIAGESAKASANFAEANLDDQAGIVGKQASGLFCQSIAQTVGAGAGYIGGNLSYEGKISESEETLNNANGALEILESEKCEAQNPVVERQDPETPPKPANNFDQLLEEKDFGKALTTEEEATLRTPSSQAKKLEAIAKARKIRDDAQGKLDGYKQQKLGIFSQVQTMGRGIGDYLNAQNLSQSQALYADQARLQAGKTSTDFAQQTGQSNMGTVIGYYSAARDHILSVLQSLDDSVTQVDNTQVRV